MKTTVELPDALFSQARRYAEAHSLTMKALVEQGLRKILAEQPDQSPFRLRDVSVSGSGLTPEFQSASWEQIRDAAYDARTEGRS